MEQAVATFMWQIERHDSIRTDERKPTHGDRMWRGGYRAAMHEVAESFAETVEAIEGGQVEPRDILRNVMLAVRAGVLVDDVDDFADRWRADLGM